ncbi:hypothetical protein [Halodesulfovibrio sp.]|uniref:hypothetical protein n=1 Tax=Halodesulfovibrio sp. TaxID=1912772 RepID=UPI0025B96031|nr:hypothetical protein [Halodesulfovibrio sp.]
MNNSFSEKKALQEQETFLQSRGFTKAPEGSEPLPGQYAIQKDKKSTPPLFSIVINSGHCLRKLTGFTDNT